MATKYDIDFKKMIVSLYQNGEKVKDGCKLIPETTFKTPTS